MVALDVISARARQVRFAPIAARFGRGLLTLLAAVLFVLGWLAAKAVTGVVVLVRGLWLAVVWIGVAVAVGWKAGRPEVSRSV